jgi:hypothetical protein
VEPTQQPGDPAWLERLPPGDREHVRAQLARIRARRPRHSASERAWRAKHGLGPGSGIVSDDLMDDADAEGPGRQ